MRNQVIITADGPALDDREHAVRIEVWRDLRMIRTYTVPRIDEHVAHIVAQWTAYRVKLTPKEII